MSNTPSPAIIQYELSITIEAKKSDVWHALTQEAQAWWLPDFHMLGPESKIQFECTAGGQLRELGTDGSSLLWYTVQMNLPGESLHLVGHVSPEYGGPATTMLSLKLAEKNGSTTLTVADAIYGKIDSATASCLELGWAQLFGEGLKQHVESK